MNSMLQKLKLKQPISLIVIFIAILLLTFQNCSSKYGISLDDNNTKSFSSDNGEAIGIDPDFKPPPPVELNLELTTKMNYETKKNLNSIRQEAVTALGTAINKGTLVFSFSQSSIVNDLKSPKGNTKFDKDISTNDVVVYMPDIDFVGNDTFDFYLLFQVGDKFYPISIVHTQVIVSSCTKVNLAIWPDHNKDGFADSLLPLGYISSYRGKESAVENYNYYSASAHIINGPTPTGFESRVFMYQPNDSDGIYLFFYFNIDNGGSIDNQVSWDLISKRNSILDSVIVTDDPNDPKVGKELALKSHDSVAQTNYYQGRFHYWSNTDGGVIGPFKGTNFEIGVNVLSSGDLNKATFFSSDNKTFSLTDQNNNLSSFIISFDSTSACE